MLRRAVTSSWIAAGFTALAVTLLLSRFGVSALTTLQLVGYLALAVTLPGVLAWRFLLRSLHRDRDDAPELADVRRFHHDWERHASLRLRIGDAAVIGIGVNLADAPRLADRAARHLGEVGPAPERNAFARDLADQFARVQSIGDGEWHFMFAVIELYQTRVNTKMTVAMERLAVIAAVTLPVTAIASVIVTAGLTATPRPPARPGPARTSTAGPASRIHGLCVG